MSLLARIFGDRSERQALRPLYDAVVAEARDPAWYRDGGVPDTLDGRFDMVAAILAVVLLRLESEGEQARREAVLLTEIFVDDMDSTLRQIGIGDFVVGKHVRRLMGALGGRLGALRDALDGDGDLAAVVRRNVFREAPASDEAVAWATERLARLHAQLTNARLDALLGGELPPA